MNKFITSPKGRKWLYKVLLAVVALVAGYGWISGEEGVLWLAVASAFLGLPLADANVDTSEPEDESLGE